MLLLCNDGPLWVSWQAPPQERKAGAAKVQENRGLIDTQPVRGATSTPDLPPHIYIATLSGHLT